MSLSSASGSVRQRNVRIANMDENENENSDQAAATSVSGLNDIDEDVSGLHRQPSKSNWNNAMSLMSELPSRTLSSGDNTSIERQDSTLRPRRENSIWNALANSSTRRRILSSHSGISDTENQRDNENVDTLTEEEIWEKCQTIRNLPASMQVKQQRKAELLQAQTMRLTGYDALKFKQNVIWRRKKEKLARFLKWFNIWDDAFKTIDGQFGMGVGSYFRFLKWLFFLNICILFIIAGAIIIPQVALQPSSFVSSIAAVNRSLGDGPAVTAMPLTSNSSSVAEPLTSQQFDYLEEAIVCSADYQQQLENMVLVESIPDKIANFLQGKGFPEQTVLFYGHYFNKTYYESDGNTDAVYIMPLAYILATAGYFILSLVLMVRNSARGFKESFVDSQSRFFQYSCKILTAWDFCMTSETACGQKHDNLYREFKLDMENERIRAHRQNRSRIVKCRLLVVRFLINIFVIATLVAAGVAIYFINEKSLEWSRAHHNEYLLLVIQYAPSVSITLLNAVIPLIFIYIVQPEDYTPEFEIKITLVRTVFLRLSSLAVLIASLYGQIAGCGPDDYNCGNCGAIKCWEVYVGQQFYKLAILDLFISIAVVLVYEFPRRKCVQHFKEYKFFKLVGLPEFDIPRSVLDLVYGQTICWIGAFFCPILPLIAVVKLFIAFYLKKASLLRNFVSSARTYRASKSNSFFTIVLLVSFILTTIPVGYSIGKIPPSKSCGPFRIYSGQSHYMFSAIGNLIASGPKVVGDVFQFVGSVSFIAPLIVVLCIAMYYYYIVASGHLRMIELLKDQLVMEGRDKRFLIDRVRAINPRYAASTD